MEGVDDEEDDDRAEDGEVGGEFSIRRLGGGVIGRGEVVAVSERATGDTGALILVRAFADGNLSK